MQIQTQSAPRPQERPSERAVLAPRVDILESDADVLLIADLPGVPDGGVRLQLERDELTLEAATQVPVHEGDPVAREFADVDYRRVFLVPKGIDADNITAELHDGVLRVRLPKSAAAQPRRIDVRAGPA